MLVTHDACLRPEMTPSDWRGVNVPELIHNFCERVKKKKKKKKKKEKKDEEEENKDKSTTTQ